MPSIGDPITQPIPPVGTTGTDYASQIDAFLTEVKTRLEADLPLSSLAAGTLDLSNNPLANAQYVGVYPGSTIPTTPVASLQNFGNDLYWVSASGAVKITNGAAINVTGIYGITGDYGGVNPAQFRFVDVDKEYYAYDDFGTGAWAKLWAQNFDIAAGPTSTTRVRLDATGVGASYTLTLPSAPASQVLLQMASTGTVTASNTLANNANLTLQGTGYIKQGNHSRQVQLRPQTAHVNSGSVTVNALKPGGQCQISTVAKFEIHQLEDTEQLQTLRIKNSCVGTGNTTLTLYVGNDSTLAFTSIGGASTTVAAGATGYTTLTPTTPSVLSEGFCYWLEVTTAATCTFDVSSVKLTVSTP